MRRSLKWFFLRPENETAPFLTGKGPFKADGSG
jgi:hypothetical protein